MERLGLTRPQRPPPDMLSHLQVRGHSVCSQDVALADSYCLGISGSTVPTS